MSTTQSPIQPFIDAGTNALRLWQQVAQASLGTFNQPILPGWTLNIDSFNSSAPDTERDILRTTSYGSQLGKITDAVAMLIDKLPHPEQAEFHEFEAMKGEIERVKERALQRRVERMRSDLELLRLTRPAEFRLVQESLRNLL